MDCGGIDTTPPEYPSALTCSSMIRPLVEFSVHGHRAGRADALAR